MKDAILTRKPLALVVAALLVLAVALPLLSDQLININLGHGEKVGKAAAGQTTNDFWNNYGATNESGIITNGLLIPLLAADGTNAAAGLYVYNVLGLGTNATGDAMFDSYVRADNGTNITLVITNLAYGTYDIYVYGHGNTDENNSVIELVAAWQNYGTKTTTNTAAWNTATWAEGAQYVVFRDVAVPNVQMVWVYAKLNASGQANINGVQIVGKATPSQDSDGDDLSDADELALGTNPFAADTDGDGVSDNVEYLQGRNPLAGAVNDTNNALGLTVYTVLR